MGAYFNNKRFFLMKAVNLVAVVVILVAFSSWAAEAFARDSEVEAQILEAQRAASRGPYATDGVFEGSAQGYGGLVTMRVIVDNGYIDSVEIVDATHEDAPWLEMCVGLPDAIVKAQSPNIDVISGATYTSAGILNGTSEALKESMAGEAS